MPEISPGGSSAYFATGTLTGETVQAPAQEVTAPRQIASSGGWNLALIPRNAQNVQVLPMSKDVREITLQNIGNFAVWVTNGINVAPQGMRLGVLESVKILTDQPVFLSSEIFPSSIYPRVISNRFGVAQVIGVARVIVNG